MANKTSQHILSTSANLLGFCLIVITSLHIANLTERYIIDEVTSAIAVMLGLASFFSFLSIRTKNAAREKQLENVADYLFMASLGGIIVVILMIPFNFL